MTYVSCNTCLAEAAIVDMIAKRENSGTVAFWNNFLTIKENYPDVNTDKLLINIMTNAIDDLNFPLFQQ